MSDFNSLTSNKTRILLSFAMAEHGGAFAHWLRHKLMTHYVFAGTNSVYMDCVASRDLPSFHHTEALASNVSLKGFTHIAPDRRDVFKSQGYMPIGAMNSNWNPMYLKAMSEADAMIMVVTPSYLASQWCAKEWAQFQEERASRPSFKGIAIRFWDSMDHNLWGPKTGETAEVPTSVRARSAAYEAAINDAPGSPLEQRGIKILNCHKAFKRGGTLFHPDDWAISDTDLNRLYNLIGKL